MLANGGLRAERDTHPCLVHHGDVVCPVADRDRALEGDIQGRGPRTQAVDLHLGGHDATQHAARQDAARDLEAVRRVEVDAERRGQGSDDFLESTGHDAEFSAGSVNRVDQLARTLRGGDR